MKRYMLSFSLAVVALATSAWAANQEITTPCTINHDSWPLFSATQWEYQVCPVSLPPVAPYGIVEVTIAPITQIAPSSHPGWEADCRYATPTRTSAPAGLAVTTTTDGTAVRALAINLRDTPSHAGTLIVGIECH